MKEHKLEIDVTLDLSVGTDTITELLALSNLAIHTETFWAEICWEIADYQAALQRVYSAGCGDKVEILRYERVEAEILEGGSKLIIYDREADEDHELTLEKLLNGFKRYIPEVVQDGFRLNNRADLNDLDFSDASKILQYAVFGRIIYEQ